MNRRITVVTGTIAVALSAVFVLCIAMAGGTDTAMEQHTSVLKALSSQGHFKTLITAVKQAGLEDTLEGEGPYTVFAPTDEAFAKLPKGELNKLLKDPEKLRSVLLYHVVHGELSMADLGHGESLDTVNGELLPVTFHGRIIYLGHAQVTQTPLSADNGLVYPISEVLMPPEME